MPKKIFVAGLMQESNSFAIRLSDTTDFTVSRGEELLSMLPAVQIFRKAGYQVIPGLMARAVPGGCLKKKAYDTFCAEILSALHSEVVDGIWLYLHGALEVVGLGSGEAELLRRMREQVGESIPIAVAMDLHANNTPELIGCANIITGYRTAPHVDAAETQVKAAELLLHSLDLGSVPRLVMARIPVLIPGERATTSVEPMCSLIRELDNLAQQPGIWYASFFVGMAWVDTTYSGANVVLVVESGYEQQAGRIAVAFAEKVWSLRRQFQFEEETGEPDQAIDTAARQAAIGERPFFLTDSGDNVTAGAPGDSIHLLKKILSGQWTGFLVAGIADQPYVQHCSQLPVGAVFSCPLGGNLDAASGQLTAPAILLWHGILPNQKDSRTEAVLARYRGQADDAGDQAVDVLVTDKRLAFTDSGSIEQAPVKTGDYPVIIVKQGYLFDALRRIAKRSMMVLTPGTTDLCLERFTYSKVHRPAFPLDSDEHYQAKDYLVLA
ncbi:MAG: M81 family metallopeptidase [Bacillota bacterium]|nr:M81 family metallopeptidase [Bacillota bacterium]